MNNKNYFFVGILTSFIFDSVMKLRIFIRIFIKVLLVTSFIPYFNQTALETTLTPFKLQVFSLDGMMFKYRLARVEIRDVQGHPTLPFRVG